MQTPTNNEMKQLIEQWSNKTHRIAYPYPRKRYVSFDGSKRMQWELAYQYMKNEVLNQC